MWDGPVAPPLAQVSCSWAMARLPLVEVDLQDVPDRNWLAPADIQEAFRRQPRFVHPDLGSLRWTVLSTVLPGLIFVRCWLPASARAEADDTRHGAWSRAVCIGWAAAALIGLVAAACRNPGVVPRAPASVKSPQTTPAARYIVVNGVQVRQRWCATCRVFRPLRSKHCSYCDRCIFRFDHHCTWLGNCVGMGNYRSFLFLVITAALFFAHSASIALEVLCLDMSARAEGDRSLPSPSGHHRQEVMRRLFLCNAGKLIYFTYAVIMFLAFLVLILYHAIIMRCNLTTNEHVRDYYIDRNPFDISCWDNYRQILCAPYNALCPGGCDGNPSSSSRNAGKTDIETGQRRFASARPTSGGGGREVASDLAFDL